LAVSYDHTDGSFQENPFSHALYHIVACPREGATVFAPLTEIVEGLPEEKRRRWDRLYTMTRGRPEYIVHPLVYSHPETGKPVLCFHLAS
jgi:taurine dioxygenase